MNVRQGRRQAVSSIQSINPQLFAMLGVHVQDALAEQAVVALRLALPLHQTIVQALVQAVQDNEIVLMKGGGFILVVPANARGPQFANVGMVLQVGQETRLAVEIHNALVVNLGGVVKNLGPQDLNGIAGLSGSAFFAVAVGNKITEAPL